MSRSIDRRNKEKKSQQRARNRRSGPLDAEASNRKAIEDGIAKAGKPVDETYIRKFLSIRAAKDRRQLKRVLEVLIREGVLTRNRRGLYALPKRMDLVSGEVIGHADGYGFVSVEGGDDLWLSPRTMHEVMHGDRVMARPSRLDDRGRRSGVVVELLQARDARIVGRYREDQGVGFVTPDDRRISHDIVISPEEPHDARDGDIVVAELTGHPHGDGHASGRVSEILGDSMAPGMEIDIAIRKHGIPHEWSKGLIREARKLAVPVSDRELDDRIDLTELALVTIDGEDARDFDDAVYAAKTKTGWRLVVAIADVSHYVTAGSTLDEEAEQRGNSVYFPRRVVPMLPEALSNGMCSLNPNERRLCMYCDMQISKAGEIVDYEFGEGVMQSRRRLTYTEVGNLLNGADRNTPAETRKLQPELRTLADVYEALLKVRNRRGALDLDMPEANIVLGKNLRIESIGVRSRNIAHRIIEECMLAANVCAAEFIGDYANHGIFRIHEAPEAESIQELKGFLAEFGVKMSTARGEIQVANLQSAVEGIRKRPDLSVFLQMSVLRAMQQAEYSCDDKGHFALGYETYTHFTSPIRRYPDLLVHRIIKAIIEEVPAGEMLPRAELQALAEHSSMTERRADDATRDVERWLKAEFMSDRIGEDFDSLVTGVTGFGVFVQLKEYFVDGLVHISDLGRDYFHHEASRFRLVGEKTGRIYRPGTELRVRLARVDLEEGKIDFILSEPDKAAGKRGRRRSKPGKSKPGKSKNTKKTQSKSKSSRKKSRKNARRK